LPGLIVLPDLIVLPELIALPGPIVGAAPMMASSARPAAEPLAGAAATLPAGLFAGLPAGLPAGLLAGLSAGLPAGLFAGREPLRRPFVHHVPYAVRSGFQRLAVGPPETVSGGRDVGGGPISGLACRAAFRTTEAPTARQSVVVLAVRPSSCGVLGGGQASAVSPRRCRP
jgi:hypothetical protein